LSDEVTYKVMIKLREAFFRKLIVTNTLVYRYSMLSEIGKTMKTYVSLILIAYPI
jgi:hypothetical protein